MSKVAATMQIASAVAKLSKCNKAKVGAIIVDQDNRIISTGYNGTPIGTCNECEDENGKTKPEVIHAECNAILFANRSLKGCTLYVTLSPCTSCAPLILQCGISKVIYKDEYRCTKGIDYLRKYGVEVVQLCDLQREKSTFDQWVDNIHLDENHRPDNTMPTFVVPKGFMDILKNL